MKGIFAFLVGMALLLSGARADTGWFAVVTKAQEGAPSTTYSQKWNLEVGEAFPLLCYAEYKDGRWVESDNKRFSVLSFDGCVIIAPTENLSFVETSAAAAHAATHRQMVAEYREAWAKADAEANRPVYTFRGSTDPKENAYLLRRTRALQRGASEADLNAIDMQRQMELQTEELRRIRDQQWIFHGGRGWSH